MNGPELSRAYFTTSPEDLIVCLDEMTALAEPNITEDLGERAADWFDIYYHAQCLNRRKDSIPHQPNSLKGLTVGIFSTPFDNLPNISLSGEYEFRNQEGGVYRQADPELLSLHIQTPIKTDQLVCQPSFQESDKQIVMGHRLSFQAAELVLGYYRKYGGRNASL